MNQKGLIITGLAFLIALILIASVNYLMLGTQKENQANIVKMQIDAVNNRHQDALGVVNKSIEEAHDNAENCTEFYKNTETYLNESFNNQAIWNTGEANMPSQSHSVENQCDQDNQITVKVDYTIKTNEEEIQKTTELEETHPYE